MSFKSLFRAVGRVARPRAEAIAIAASLAIVVLVLQTGLGQSALRAVGLSRPTAPFVELYFPDARALPSTAPKSGPLEIRFALGNVGSTSNSFAWSVSDNSGTALTNLASGRSVVGAGRTVVIARRIRVVCARKLSQLLVSV